jgi:hypothetical protein
VRFVETIAAVLVGGLISFAASYLSEKRRERTVEARETRASSLEARTAIRQVWNELNFARGEIEGALMLAYWPEQLPLDQWRRHSDVLARALPADAWGSVTIAAGRVAETNRGEPDPNGPYQVTAEGELSDHLLELENADHVLRSLLASLGDTETGLDLGPATSAISLN